MIKPFPNYFRIMALSGHKTTSCFKRYSLVTEDELRNLNWPSEGRKIGTMDTYIDTNEKRARRSTPNPLKLLKLRGLDLN